MIEYLVVVDKNDRVSGKENPEVVQQKWLWHRGIRVFVRNAKHEWLLLKRPKTKLWFADCWEIGIGGSVRHRESYLSAALREIREEIGVRSSKLKKIAKLAVVNKQERVHASVYILTLRPNSKLRLQKSEIVAHRWVTEKTIFNFPKRMKRHEISFHYFKKWSREGML